MPTTMTPTTPTLIARPLRPGFLAGPLGWLTDRLAKALTTDPELFATLFELNNYRMHVLALGLAHHNGEPPADLVKCLMAGRPTEALRPIIGQCPQGLDRALLALPEYGVLGPECYRALVSLLNDRATAKYLHHCRAINSTTILGLDALPEPLRRPAIFKLFGEVEGMEDFVSGLQFLCVRSGMAFDGFVEYLGTLDQTDQVVAKIADLAENLPLPDHLPSPRIGPFARLDQVAQIRALAKSWANCVANNLHEINEGTNLVYLSTEHGPPAAALVIRVDRLGWALAQIKGPRNVDLDRDLLAQHHNTFADAGIPRSSQLAAIKGLLWRRQFGGRRRR